MSRFCRSARSRAVCVAVGAGVIGSLVFAGPSSANPPLNGVNCQVDGKIHGNGATFARNLQIVAFIPGYTTDVCGPVADVNHPSAMVLYNETTTAGTPTWPVGTIGTTFQTGSGNGLKGMKCRTSAFNMSDNPYSNSATTPPAIGSIQESRIAPPLADAQCTALSGDVAFIPPYEPTTGGTFPVAADSLAVPPARNTAGGTNPPAANGAMSFPVGGAAVTVGANLDAAQCPGIAGTTPVLNLDESQVSRLFGATIVRWDDGLLLGSSPELAFCDGDAGDADLSGAPAAGGTAGLAITRVVRLDSSGTTTQFKNYLVRGNPGSGPDPEICEIATTADSWSEQQTLGNIRWPGDATPTAQPNCPQPGQPGQLIRPAQSGGNHVVASVLATPASIGYADYENWQQGFAGATLASLRAQTGGLFVRPDSGQGSNCNFSQIGAQLPGGGPTGAVGLNPAGGGNTNWATNAVPNRSNITFIGTGYPACALTWQLVYAGLNGNCITPPLPIECNGVQTNTTISRLNQNQRRTLYAYKLYELSPLGQATLPANGFAALPTTFVNSIAAGFRLHY